MEKTKRTSQSKPAPVERPILMARLADDPIDLLDRLEKALPKGEFWTPQLCAAQRAAAEFLKKKGLRQ